MIGLSYLFGKALQKIQIATFRNCVIHPTAKVCQKSNLVNVSLGRYSYVGAANSINNVEIGSFCSIASYCAIGGGRHPIDFVSTSPLFLSGNNIFGVNFAELQFNESPRTTIGSDVWIGEASFVKAGVSIGHGAIVGAHSVVTKDVPPYAIVAGTPAHLLRFRFSQEIVEGLLETEWWNWPEAEIRNKADLFLDPELLLGDCYE